MTRLKTVSYCARPAAEFARVSAIRSFINNRFSNIFEIGNARSIHYQEIETPINDLKIGRAVMIKKKKFIRLQANKRGSGGNPRSQRKKEGSSGAQKVKRIPKRACLGDARK